MNKMDRFEDALTQLAKASVGKHGDHYAYMSGYLLSLVRELTHSDERGMRIIERSIRDTEATLFERTRMREVDTAA